jgi:hypothetical protein
MESRGACGDGVSTGLGGAGQEADPGDMRRAGAFQVLPPPSGVIGGGEHLGRSARAHPLVPGRRRGPRKRAYMRTSARSADRDARRRVGAGSCNGAGGCVQRGVLHQPTLCATPPPPCTPAECSSALSSSGGGTLSASTTYDRVAIDAGGRILLRHDGRPSFASPFLFFLFCVFAARVRFKNGERRSHFFPQREKSRQGQKCVSGRCACEMDGAAGSRGRRLRRRRRVTRRAAGHPRRRAGAPAHTPSSWER